jgi:hypothetical protein
VSEPRDHEGPAEPGVRDSSDIIEGEIGHARLKEPSDDPDTGADLDKLPEIESGPGVGGDHVPDPRHGAI